MTDCAPLNAVMQMTKENPRVWEFADILHDEERHDPHWGWNDNLCYINISAAISCLSQGQEPSESDYRKAALCAALSTWRRNKTVYTFDPTLAEELTANAEDLVIPVHILLHMPAACPYIQLPPNDMADGFLAFLDDSPKGRELRLLYLDAAGKLIFRNFIHLLPGGTIRGGIQQAKRVIRENTAKLTNPPEPHQVKNAIKTVEDSHQLCCRMMQLLLYICAVNADIEEDSQQTGIYRAPRPGYPILDKYRETRKWIVGRNTGKNLHQSRQTTCAAGNGKTKRPHVRQSHWHHYWVGPRDDQELVLKWLSPIMVHGGGSFLPS